MTKKTNKSFSYYFLNSRLTPPVPRGYRVSIVNLIINDSKDDNQGKVLLIQQAVGTWGLPREGIKSAIVVDDIFPTIARMLEEELGFRGPKVIETKPEFRQVALLLNFDTQLYGKKRSKDESSKNRPTKGKTYHLAIMQYSGPSELPIIKDKNNPEVIDYKWVSKSDGKKLIASNTKQLKGKPGISESSLYYNIDLFEKVIKTYNQIRIIYNISDSKQNTLF